MKNLFLFMAFVAFGKICHAQKPDHLIGTWITEDKDAWVEFFKRDGKYFGKTVWHDSVKHKGIQTDVMNPKKELRNRPIIGLNVIKNLTFDDDEWSNGECYDPESGNYYKGTIKYIDKNKIKLRGYIGIPLFGRSEVWTRKP